MSAVKRRLALLLAILLMGSGRALGEAATYGRLLADLLAAYETPAEGDLERIDGDVAALGDDVAEAIAAHWKAVYLNPDYRLYLYGKDDPGALWELVSDDHAFVVLGYELKNGEMTQELKGRCEAAAEAARRFPEAVLVCSGGPTGRNNPHNHTEAGLMKDYLSGPCGIAAERILIDERAMSTVENAVNTLALLQAHNIESMTLVTSVYHQRWAQAIYNAVNALYGQEYGYSARLVGNYSYDVEPPTEYYRDDARIAVVQLGRILRLPEEEMALLPAPKR